MLNYTSNYIEIENEYVSKIFNSKELLSMSIEGQKNCCTPIASQKFNLEFDPTCIYVASYQNYDEQSSCSPTPGSGGKVTDNCESTPLSVYYSNVVEVKLFIDGESTNILSKSYLMTNESDVALLKTDIDSYFTNKGIIANTVINAELSTSGFLKVEIKISNLPTNVVFESFILANNETCYVDVTAECFLGIKCNKNKFILPANVAISSFVTANGTYTPPTIFNTASIETAQVGLIEFLNDTRYSFEYEGNDLIINGTDNPILYVKYSINTTTTGSFPNCIGYAEDITSCNYTVKIPTTGFINSLTGYNNTNSFTSPILTSSLKIDALTIASSITALLTTGSVEAILEDNLIALTFKDIDFVPFKLEVDNENYYFQCDQLNYFEGEYNADLIEFVGNGLRLKPEYLGIITNGVYNFTLTTETQTQVITDSYCVFVDLDLQCKIAKLTDLDKLEEAILLYEDLKSIHECIDCECESACVLYQELNNILKSYNLVNDDCNC